MANSIHLSFLKQGIEVWNNWREHNPNIIPDLSKADLSGLNLNQGDFRYAKLHSVNLRKAQLYNTNFCNADLRAADLSRAKIAGADFSNADLTKADFSNTDATDDISVNFENAKIKGTNFTKANLNKANFTRCKAGLNLFSFRHLFVIILSLFFSFFSAYPAFIFLTFYLYFFNLHFRKRLSLLLSCSFFGSIFLALLIRGPLNNSFIQYHSSNFIKYHIGAGTGMIFVTVLFEFLLIRFTNSDKRFTTKFILAFVFVVLLVLFIFFPTSLFDTLQNFFGINNSNSELGKAIFGAVIGAIYGAWVSYSAITGKHFNWLWRLYVEDVVHSGTSFKNANLTGAVFNSSILTSANFTNALIEKASWWDIEDLEFIIFGKTYLKYPQIRQIFQSSAKDEKIDSYDLKLDTLNLEGINFADKDLSDASFIRTNLRNSNLSNTILINSNLTEANLRGANLTGACLTGSFLKDINYDKETIFKDIKCDYIFLDDYRYSINSRPFPPTKNLQAGDFENIFKKEDNLELLIRNTDNLESIDFALSQIFKAYNIETNSFRGLRKIGEYFLVELKVPQNSNINKALIEQDFERMIKQPIDNLSKYKREIHDSSLIITKIMNIIEKNFRGIITDNLEENYRLALEESEEKYKTALKFKDEEIAVYKDQTEKLKEIIDSLSKSPILIKREQKKNQD